MDSSSKPSITGILQTNRDSVNGTADLYLSYFNQSNQQDSSKRSDDDTRRRHDATIISNAYYDLVTDFYEYGWGDAFHFAVLQRGESREHSFAKHEYHLALRLGIQKTDRVLVSLIYLLIYPKNDSRAMPWGCSYSIYNVSTKTKRIN